MAGNASAEVNASLLTTATDRDGLTFEVQAHADQPIFLAVPPCDKVTQVKSGSGLGGTIEGEHDRFAHFWLQDNTDDQAPVGHAVVESGRVYSVTVNRLPAEADDEQTKPTQILIEPSKVSCSGRQ